MRSSWKPSQKTEDEERRTASIAIAEERYAEIVATGKTIPWAEMRSSLEDRVAGKKRRRPAAKKLARRDVSRIELAVGVGDDFERILEHLSDHEVEDSPARIGEIIDAIDVLGTSSLIGHPAAGDLRELIIGRRARGYVALYR